MMLSVCSSCHVSFANLLGMPAASSLWTSWVALIFPPHQWKHRLLWAGARGARKPQATSYPPSAEWKARSAAGSASSAQMMTTWNLCQKLAWPEAPSFLPKPILTTFCFLSFPLKQALAVRAVTKLKNFGPQEYMVTQGRQRARRCRWWEWDKAWAGLQTSFILVLTRCHLQHRHHSIRHYLDYIDTI